MEKYSEGKKHKSEFDVHEPRNGNVNTVYFIHQGKYSNQSHGDCLFSMNEHVIANVCFQLSFQLRIMFVNKYILLQISFYA